MTGSVVGGSVEPEKMSESPATPPIGEPILEARYQMTFGEMLRAGPPFARQMRSTIAATVVFGLGGATSLLLAGDLLVGSVGLVAAVAMGSGWFSVATMALLGWRRRSLFEQATHLTVDTLGVRITTPMASTRFVWNVCKRVRESRTFFFLDYGTGAGMLIPKRAFEGASLEQFRTQLAEHGLLRD